MTRQSRAHVLALLGHEPVAQPRLGACALAQGAWPCFWYGGDKTPWLFVAITVFVVAALGFGLRSAIAYQDERRQRVREFHQQSLTCLARNVYFEARGEPIAGQ